MQGSPIQIQIYHTPEEFASAAKRALRTREAVRYRVVRSITLGTSIPDAAYQHGVSDDAARKWVYRYNEGGLEALADPKWHGRPAALVRDLEEAFKKRMLAGPLPDEGLAALRGVDAQRILKEEFDVELSLSATYDTLQRVGLSNLVPRPSNPRKNKEEGEAFKKISQPCSRRRKPRTPSSASKSGSKMRRDLA